MSTSSQQSLVNGADVLKGAEAEESARSSRELQASPLAGVFRVCLDPVRGLLALRGGERQLVRADERMQLVLEPILRIAAHAGARGARLISRSTDVGWLSERVERAG